MTPDVISKELDLARSAYPENQKWLIDANRKRLQWQLEQVVEKVPEGGEIVDIGGGIVPFMSTLQKYGYKTTIIDDLGDDTVQNDGSRAVIDQIREAGVRLIGADAFDEPIEPLTERGFDMVTSHDSMEHWRNSPKAMLHRFWERMPSGGVMWIGVPNCVNLRKRITVPLGYGKWSQMRDWYEPEIFRGHVREPDVDDLRYIARDLGASKVEIQGKNWLAYRHPNKFIKTLAPVIDPVLRIKPSLCSDIYLFAWK